VLPRPNLVSTMGLATAMAAWGAAGMPLRGGVVKGSLQGWRSPAGGRGRRSVDEQREREGS
jgi:hypothetical protein